MTVTEPTNSWELVQELKKKAEIFRKLDAKPDNGVMLISKETLALARKFYGLVEELYDLGKQINSNVDGPSK